jgi:DNA-binding MarR family transcriptional regulator
MKQRQGLPIARVLTHAKPGKAGMQETRSGIADSAPAESRTRGDDADRLLTLVHWTSAASRQLRRRLAEVAAAIDLSDVELLVLWLCHGGGQVQVDLAAAIGISPAQVSGLVERLRSRELVAMRRSATDRRRQVWRTAAAGETLLGEVASHFDALAAAVDGGVSTAQQQTVAALCRRLVEAVGQHGRRTGSNLPRLAEQDEQRASKEAA